MRVPSWLVYTLVLAVVATTLFVSSGRDGEVEIAGARVPGIQLPAIISAPKGEKPPLPESSIWDEKVLVQVGQAENGLGTAFAINQSGIWLTARHVVDGCSQVGLVVGGGRVFEVDGVRTSPQSDLAVLFTDRAPHALQLGVGRELRVGETGFHIGFPQGKAGEAVSQLTARSRLVTEGRYRLEEPVLTWTETARSEDSYGSLAGMSGGPVFDTDGAVVGVTIAESPTRGRIYTASPDSISEFLDEQGLSAPGDESTPVSPSSYSREAERLRREMAVVKVICRVENEY